MKKLILGLAIVASVSTYAHSTISTDESSLTGVMYTNAVKICETEVPNSYIFNANEGTTVIGLTKRFEADGAKIVICTHVDNLAVVAIHPNGVPYAILFED